MELKVVYEHLSDTVTVVTVEGEYDVYASPGLRAALIELIDQGRLHLVLDMSGVEFVDSTFLGVVVGARKRLRAGGGGMALMRITPEVTTMLSRMGAAKLFRNHASVAHAVEALTHTEPRRALISPQR
ncbi:STAS domain-containing protein [Streptomyces sp. LX-29]|uniref:STAS domain-containing protein n=1 Tax=Streptomyces sp. LX-29 TaxID=2900152 RepID=UPI00240DE3DD|nr:STAS domain-containing protein [Streptomyces sp. LX-29]WFB09640.1 STAS domain-containing protein [Streptomyces sp. LX-29]